VATGSTLQPNKNSQTIRTIRIVLFALMFLSLIPALMLAKNRIDTEDGLRNVTLLLDEYAVAEQAELLGISSFELAQRYKALGINGIAVYEETLETLEREGDVVYLTGGEVLTALQSNPDIDVEIEGLAGSSLVRELTPNALSQSLLKNFPAPKEVTLFDQNWYLFEGNAQRRPAGISDAEIAQWKDAGWEIAYRPRNFPQMSADGIVFPEDANYIVHASTEISGHPNQIDTLITASQPYLTALIEGQEQDGMSNIAKKVPTARLFSINQDWLNTLQPQTVVDKYILAANERGAKLLYVRPYTKEKMGDMFANTEELFSGLTKTLKAEGYTIGSLTSLEYEGKPLLRQLSIIGVIAGLLLLATLYPQPWGILVSLAVLALGILAGGGLNWDALALCAALSFPLLGYGLLSKRFYSIFIATAISLIGAVFLAAVGTDTPAMLAAEPFAGVAATLVIPPALFLFHFLLKFRRPVDWLVGFWNYKIRLGDVMLLGVVFVALALVFLRRGNFPIIGTTGIELIVRDFLSEHFARPRFKELLGHPMAVLALLNTNWLPWVRGLLLTGGIVAQATILNSFSHYHTPLTISLERTLVALVIGTIIGLILVPISRLAVSLVQRWLATATVDDIQQTDSA